MTPVEASSLEVRVARIDERTVAMQEDIHSIQAQLRETGSINSRTYVTRTEFAPVQKLVYGMVALMLSSVLVGMVALVIHK